jgi:hypothetical protein
MVLGTPAAKKAAGSSGSSGDPKSSGKKEAESPAAEPPTVAAVADEDGTQAAKPADLAKLLKKGINLFLDLTKQ